MASQLEWDVVVLGGANTDYVVRGARLPAVGETLEGDSFLETPGGKGANQAVAAARLGARVALISRVGNDARGDALVRQLRAEGVDTRYITRDGTAPTGVALIMVNKAGEKQIFAAPGAVKGLDEACIQAAAPALQSTKVVLSQLEAPVRAVEAAFRIGAAAGAQVVLDPAPAHPLSNDFLKLVDVIRPNAAEASALTGLDVSDRSSALRAALRLLNAGVRAAIVPAGKAGVVLHWHEGEMWLPRIPVNVIDATGAGDAFAAALATRLAESCELAEAARFANAAAALATTKWGAQVGLPRREEVEALLRRT